MTDSPGRAARFGLRVSSDVTHGWVQNRRSEHPAR
jgi:hypothetical protein